MHTEEWTSSLIKTFHLAVTYLKIYPPTSQMAAATLDTLTRTLNLFFEVHPTVTLSDLSGKLLVDGTEPASRELQMIGGSILRLFSQRKVHSITFRAGCTREELTAFITALIRHQRDNMPAFEHIGLDQTTYVAIVKGEEAVAKITDIIHGAGSDIAGLITSLRESYDLIDTVPDPQARTRAHDHLAQELARQDPEALREIFERELPAKIEQSGLKQKLLNALSQEKIQAIFGNISRWYDQIRQAEGSDFAAVERLEKLKVFMQTILTAPAARQVPMQFFEDLMRKGVMDQLPDWLSAEHQKPASVLEIEQLLDKSAVDLMDPAIAAELPQIAQRLCQMEASELLGRLVEKILENFGSSAARIRLQAADCLLPIYEILDAQARTHIIKTMELPVLAAARRETSADVYGPIITIARRIAAQNILYADYEFTTRVFELLGQHTDPGVVYDEKIRALAAPARRELTADIMDVLVADLSSGAEKRKMGALHILAKVGDGAVVPLIRVIKESEDVRARRLAAEALAVLGPAARRRFGEELNLGLSTAEMRHTIDVLPLLMTDDTLQLVAALALYPDAGVRTDILRFLAKAGTNQAKALLIEQLSSTAPAIVSETVRLLAEIRCTEAVPALTGLLTASPGAQSLRAELCIALGTIGSPQAVPALVAALNKKPFFLAKNRDEWEKTRMRAAWALGKFAGPDVVSALERAARDASSAVGLTAQESLRQINVKSTGRQ